MFFLSCKIIIISPDGGGFDNAIGLHVDLIILFRPVYPSTGEVHLTAKSD